MSGGKLGWVVLGILGVGLLSGCPRQGIVCTQGLSQCGVGCADTQSDVRNCGACGNTCGVGQVCVSGACQCQEGATWCTDACIVLANSAEHCGACGHACDVTQV